MSSQTNQYNRLRYSSAMILVGWILTIWIVASPGYAADVIYKYQDDQGVTHYTDKLSLIPEKYCSRAQPFNPDNAPVTVTTIPSTLPPTQGQPEAPSFYASWLEQMSKQFSKLTIPDPFPYPLAIALVVFLVAMIIILRLTMPPMTKALLTIGLVVLLSAGFYWMNSEKNNLGPTRLSAGCTTPGTPR